MPLVLLVEDHRDTRLMYAEFLRDTFEVMEAEAGDEALDLMRARVPDLLITDLSLPGLDGFALITRIRRDPRLTAVPVICLSGYGGHSLQVRAREAGCQRVIEKPCLPDMLLAAATDLLRNRPRERQTT